jgi:hypothetical protein
MTAHGIVRSRQTRPASREYHRATVDGRLRDPAAAAER